MYCKFAFATLAMLIGSEFVISEHIPPTTTASELWNPWTWFWPYAIAAAEGYRDYFQKAQKATNELYQQAEKLNAFPWLVKPSVPQDNNQGGNGGQNNQGGSTNPNQNTDKGQNNQGGSTQPNQNADKGQSNQGGSTQSNQNGDKGQNNQASPSKPNQNANQTPTENATQEQSGKGEAGSPSAQVQGNTQENGKTDTGISANA